MDLNQPFEGFEAGSENLVVVHAAAAENHGLGQTGVGVGEDFLEPAPVWSGGVGMALDEFSEEGFANLSGSAIAGEATEVFVDSDQGEGPGAGRGKRQSGREGLFEEFGGEHLESAADGLGDAKAKSPKGVALAVFGPGFVEPAAIKAHEIVEATELGIEGVMKEGGVGGGAMGQARRSQASALQDHGQGESAGVVVGAIAFGKKRGSITRMLKNAGGISETKEMIEFQLWQMRGLLIEGLHGRLPVTDEVVIRARLLEGIEIHAGDPTPNKFAPEAEGVLAHLMALRFVAEELDDGGRDGGGITERDEFAAAIGEQFLGVPVRGGDDRVAEAKGVGEGAGGDLGFAKVRSEVNIGGADETHQLFEFDEAVEEDDMLLDAEIGGETFEAPAIGLAFVADQVGVGLAEDDVHDVGEFANDVGEGAEGVFNAFVWREEAKGQEDLFSGDGEFVFVVVGIGERDVGNAMRDEVYLFHGGAKDLVEQLAALLGHDDEAGGEANQFAHDAALLGAGVFKNGVKGGDDGHAQFAQQPEEVAADRPAENAVFVLDADDIDVGDIKEISGAKVGGEVLLGDFESHFRRIIVTFGEIVDRGDQTFDIGKFGGDGRPQVAGKSGNAAFARGIIGEEGDFSNGRGLLHALSE